MQDTFSLATEQDVHVLRTTEYPGRIQMFLAAYYDEMGNIKSAVKYDVEMSVHLTEREAVISTALESNPDDSQLKGRMQAVKDIMEIESST